MKTLRPIKTAVKALRRNLTRSLLTMLGIEIGIAAVITMIEIGNGAADQIAASISNMGSNILMITPYSIQKAGVSTGSGTGITLTSDDCEAIISECPSVRDATPVMRGGSLQVVAGNKNWSPESVNSGSETYFDVNEWKISDGEAFTARDVAVSARVCVLGQTVSTALFGSDSSVGQEVRLNNVIFTVCGVLASKGANLMGMDQNDTVIVPWTSMRNRLTRSGGQPSSGSSSSTYFRKDIYPTTSVALYPDRDATQAANYLMPIRFNNVNQIMAAATSSGAIKAAISEITEVLNNRHTIKDGEESDFGIRDMSELLSTLTSTSKLMTNLLLLVALISLVVGGVGIMNIMLVSVTERTREIGLRMAVGARGSNILFQFLVESVILCILGGIAGIILGRVTSTIISRVNGWPISPSISAIILSVAVSATIGIVFGFYPALRASRLNPIDALHYE